VIRALLALGVVLAGAGPPAAGMPALSRTQTLYETRCGGCHGIEGISSPRAVPSLQGQVGYFLCVPAGRAYLVRVPGVALSLIREDGDLADVMNFVVFALGAGSTPAGTPPYTAAEIARLRQAPLDAATLPADRSALVEQAIRDCGAPAALRDYR